MSQSLTPFDYATLVTDRTQGDVDALSAALRRIMDGKGTDADRALVERTDQRGAYNYTDLNRVSACMEALRRELEGLGVQLTGYERVKIERTAQPTSRLPDGYTELAYIESTGTQYVDTGIVVNKADSVRMVLDTHLTSNDNYAGCNGYMQFQASVGGGARSTIDVSYSNITETVTVNGEQKSSQSWASYNGENVKIGIFKMGDANNGWFSGAAQIGKLYSCKIYESDLMSRDFVPCIDPSGAVGLYDTVSKAFFGNAGTGVFVSGPPRVRLPAEYTELAYIESTGTQYVDTGVNPDQDTRIVIKLAWETARTQIYYGAYQSSALVWSFEQTSSGDFKDYYQNTSNYVSGTIETANAEHEIDSGPAGLYVDGELKLSRGSGSNTFAVDSTLYLFGEHYQNTRPSNNSLCADFKMYSAKIYSGAELVRDFIPAQNAAGAVGLYDLAGAKFYANAGTGSFTAGDVVEQPDDPDEPDDELDPYTWYESDAPTAPQLAQYLANVASIRAALPLPEGTASVPKSMAQLRPAQANAIEQILAALEIIIKHIPAAVRHCGVTICGSKGVIT